jgi:mRNA interferase RelE/StbE
LAWQINYTSTALKQLGKFDKPAAKRIVDFMDERIAVLQDPRDTGKALAGALLGAYWRYRVGDYRVICDIQDDVLCVLVIEVGSRKDVYARH